MKKKKGLIIGVIIMAILMAVAVWYFFFKAPSEAKTGDEPAPDPEPTDTGTGLQTDQVPDEIIDVVPTDTLGPPDTSGGNTGGGFGSGGGFEPTPCPPGTSGTPPNCILDTLVPNAIFASALVTAKTKVTNFSDLSSTQKANAINIININVPNNKDAILADAASGKDIVQLILADTQKIYLANFGVTIKLTDTARASSGRD